MCSTALAALNGREVLGSQLGVAWHVVQGAKEDTSNHITVFCGNIGDAIDEYTLFEAFAQYNCSDSRIVRGEDGRCLGYGFVTIRTQVPRRTHHIILREAAKRARMLGSFSRVAVLEQYRRTPVIAIISNTFLTSDRIARPG